LLSQVDVVNPNEPGSCSKKISMSGILRVARGGWRPSAYRAPDRKRGQCHDDSCVCQSETIDTCGTSEKSPTKGFGFVAFGLFHVLCDNLGFAKKTQKYVPCGKTLELSQDSKV